MKTYTSWGSIETIKTNWGKDEVQFNHHCGVTLVTVQPTAGVYNGIDVDWDGMGYDYIDLAWESAQDEILDREDLSDDDKDEQLEQLSDFWEGGDTHLYGAWAKGDDGLWDADKTGEFAAIYNGNVNTLQVVWSKTVKYGQLASPCYPGQVSAEIDDTDDGQQAYYALPDYCIYQER